MRKTFTAGLLILLLAGCATIVSGPEQQVPITSDPPGATVQIRDQTITTPGTAMLKRNQDYTVRISKDGYYDNVAILRQRESDWILGNLLWDLPTTGLLMFLTQGQGRMIVFGPGSICDRATGAGYRLVPDRVELILDKREAREEARRAASDRQPHVVKEIALPTSICSLHAAAGSLWVVHSDDGFLTSTSALSRIDLQTNDIVETISIPRGNGRVLVDDGALWFTTYESFTKCSLCKLDLSTKQIVAKLILPTFSPRVAVGEGAIWLLAARMEKKGLGLVTTGLEVMKVNPQTAKISGRILLDETVWGQGPVAGTFTSDIAIGPGEVWVANGSSQKVARIDSETLQVTATISVKQQVQRVAAGDDSVWVFGHALEPRNDPPAQVARIDRLNNKTGRPIFAGGVTAGRADLPAAHALGLGAVWLLNSEDGTLQWLDGATGQGADKPLFLGANFKQTSYPTGQVIVAEGSVWAAVGKQLLRIAPE
jgi:DNA-binding beta-propeller fold protein YncE